MRATGRETESIYKEDGQSIHYDGFIIKCSDEESEERMDGNGGKTEGGTYFLCVLTHHLTRVTDYDHSYET